MLFCFRAARFTGRRVPFTAREILRSPSPRPSSSIALLIVGFSAALSEIMIRSFIPACLAAGARRALLGLCFGLLAPLPATALAARQGDNAAVAANGDLTPEGKLVPRPTREQPAYYVSVILGWHEAGQVVAGEEPPKREMVLLEVAQALAKEGYILQALRSDANTTTPSLIIAIEWGYMNPSKLEVPNPPDLTGDSSKPMETATTIMVDQRNMITLVAGSAIHRRVFFTQIDWDKLRDAVDEGRYFVIVSAYDFEASVKGEQVLLWRTRMSTPRQGVWMNDVVVALVTAGTPLFGRQSDVPTWQEFRVREGRVEMGDLKIIDSDVKAPAKGAKDAKAK
jgi:hypothetical protein